MCDFIFWEKLSERKKSTGMTTTVYPEEVTSAVQALIEQQRFPITGLTPAATTFLAHSLTRLQAYLITLTPLQISNLNWGLASEVAGNIRSMVFAGNLSPSRGEVVGDVLQQTLLKLPYYRDDDNRKLAGEERTRSPKGNPLLRTIVGPIPLFSIVQLWKSYGDILLWMGYSNGVPLAITNQRSSGSSLPVSVTIDVSEDTCGGILKLLMLAYPLGGSPLRTSIFGTMIGITELRSHQGARGSDYTINFSDGSTVTCNGGQFIQGVLSAAHWLNLDYHSYIVKITDKLGRLCEIM